MSRYRKIHVKLWSSGDFLTLSKPKPNAQSLFLHLLTGEHTTAIPGVICAGKAALAEAIGWPLADWQRCFAELEERGMVVADWDSRLVYLPAALAHNEPVNPNTVRSWRNEWQLVRACALRDRIVAEMSETLASMRKPGFSEAFADVVANVPGNVPGNVRRVVPSNDATDVPQEQSAGRSGDQSADRTQERSPRTCAGARSAPATVPVSASVLEGVQGEGVRPPEPGSDLARRILAAAARLPRVAPLVDPEFANALALVVERAGKAAHVERALEDAEGRLLAQGGPVDVTQGRDVVQRYLRNALPPKGPPRGGRAPLQPTGGIDWETRTANAMRGEP